MTNGKQQNRKQVEGYEYNDKSLRDGAMSPKKANVVYNESQNVMTAQKLSGRNGAFKAAKSSFKSFLGK